MGTFRTLTGSIGGIIAQDDEVRGRIAKSTLCKWLKVRSSCRLGVGAPTKQTDKCLTDCVWDATVGHRCSKLMKKIVEDIFFIYIYILYIK